MESISMETEAIAADEQTEYVSPNKLVIDGSNGMKNLDKNDESVCEYPSLFTSKTLLELSNSSWTRSVKSTEHVQPYLRGCKWSPDGTCCLTVVNNDGVHITELPRDLYSGPVSSNRMINVLDSIIHVKEGGLVYDFCWYPHMNSSLPETCCWITTRQYAPIQMWDAFDGSLRCSYRGFNNVDEMESALSVTFTSNGNKIVAGYKKYFRTFDVQRPGREYEEHATQEPVSCFATNENFLAVGSWHASINLYSISEMGTYKSVGRMKGHDKGVTHLKFSPDGLILVSGARKDSSLLVWDIRYFRTPLNILTRAADTNQRVYFDISPCGKYLVSGGTDGIVRVWDSDDIDWKSSKNANDDRATYKFQLHKDCCNSLSIHPCRPLLATGSGQFHFKDPIKGLEENNISNSDDNSNTNNLSSDGNNTSVPPSNGCSVQIDNENILNNDPNSEVDIRYSSISENSLVFWWIGDVDLKNDME